MTLPSRAAGPSSKIKSEEQPMVLSRWCHGPPSLVRHIPTALPDDRAAIEGLANLPSEGMTLSARCRRALDARIPCIGDSMPQPLRPSRQRSPSGLSKLPRRAWIKTISTGAGRPQSRSTAPPSATGKGTPGAIGCCASCVCEGEGRPLPHLYRRSPACHLMSSKYYRDRLLGLHNPSS